MAYTLEKILADWRLTDESHVWVTPGLDREASRELESKNLASLRRKITYFVSRPEMKIQFQRVEGWTTGHIIGLMRGSGLRIDQIRRDLSLQDYNQE